MPPRSELPSSLHLKKFLTALQKCGFVVDTKGGKGSHIRAIHTNQKSITVPGHDRKIPNHRLYYIIKSIESVTDVTWDDIVRHL